eukprot:5475-Heterococcus_DN1.PRE.7
MDTYGSSDITCDTAQQRSLRTVVSDDTSSDSDATATAKCEYHCMYDLVIGWHMLYSMHYIA